MRTDSPRFVFIRRFKYLTLAVSAASILLAAAIWGIRSFLATAGIAFSALTVIAHLALPMAPELERQPTTMRRESRPSVSSENDEVSRLYSPNRCGPVALYAVCSAYGVPASLAELEQLAETDARGTTLAGLVRAANAKGLNAVAYESDIGFLKSISGPAIIDIPKGHYCAFLGWRQGRALIVDPACPVQEFDLDDIDRLWGRSLMLFSPKSSPGKK